MNKFNGALGMPPTKTAETREKPTLKTIAQLSGLAVPTVSRALNDAPDIGQKTKEKVRRIASEIGYVPNRAGVRLRTGRTNVISLVMSTHHDVMNHTSRLISSVASGLRDTGFHLIVTPFFPEEDALKPVRYIVETGSADAVILNQIEPEDPRVAYLRERRFPFATHGRTVWCDQHAYYDYDNQAFARIAGAKMAAIGRKRLVVIAPPRSHNYAKHMIAGFREAAEVAGTELRVLDNVTSDSTSAEVKATVARLLQDDPGIDAIACASTSSAMAAVAGLEAVGRKLGVDIDLCAKEAIPFLTLFRPDIIAVSEKVDAAGEFLARAAIQAIRDPSAAPLQQLEVPTDT